MNRKTLGFFRDAEASTLAKQIHSIEHARFRCRKSWIAHGRSYWDLLDKNGVVGNIYVTKSHDCMMWYLWKRVGDQARPFWRCVPKMNLTVKEIERILSAQSWTCI